MSSFKVEIVAINGIVPHPNADRLDLAVINGWQCVVGKGSFAPGDAAVYLPIDSLLPTELELKLFPIGSKIKLKNSRIRTIKLRGAISQGMLIKPSELGLAASVGDDVTTTLGVTKYEPPQAPARMGANMRTVRRNLHPDFRKYTAIENAKNYPQVFEQGEEVVVTEKIHGTNFRAGYVPYHTDTLWKKLRKWIGYAPKWEFVYGSHNVQLQNKLLYTGYYDKNVYAECVTKYSLRERLRCDSDSLVIYGEIYGDGVQKGYSYGCGPDERKLVVFDIMLNGAWLNHDDMSGYCKELGLPMVPELHRGPYDGDKILALRDGASVLAPSQKVREGVVVRPMVEQLSWIGRKMLKYISDEYLLRNEDGTDFH